MTPNEKFLPCLVVASLTLNNFALAQDSAAAEHHPRSVIMMEKLDADKDGQISKEEHVSRGKDEAQKARFTKQFNKFDADKNGLLSYPELNARFSSVKKK